MLASTPMELYLLNHPTECDPPVKRIAQLAHTLASTRQSSYLPDFRPAASDTIGLLLVDHPTDNDGTRWLLSPAAETLAKEKLFPVRGQTSIGIRKILNVSSDTVLTVPTILSFYTNYYKEFLEASDVLVIDCLPFMLDVYSDEQPGALPDAMSKLKAFGSLHGLKVIIGGCYCAIPETHSISFPYGS